MAKTVLTAVLIVLLNVLVGCKTVDTGRSQLMPARTTTSLGSAPVVEVGKAKEADYVEQVAVNRQAYRQGLELLVQHYTKTGNSMKLTWAKRELEALNSMAQYNYIIGAGVIGAGSKASIAIAEADYLYRDGVELEDKAGLLFFKNKNTLRLALDKYNQVINKHPSSDKIDDAAYRAGRICEHFKDYTIALLYYQRAYQWDTETIYPARFREAFVLDKRLRRRAEALKAYKRALKAIKRKGEHYQWIEFAEERIRVLTKTEEGSK
ncbi:MAG: tetratricopeptide repeat protein [Planctomycetota bacterium]|jgi:tetratricopeptide (TPR) repeat protein